MTVMDSYKGNWFFKLSVAISCIALDYQVILEVTDPDCERHTDMN